MNILSNFFERNRSVKLVWVIVIFSILFSLYGTKIELSGGNLVDNPVFQVLLSPLDNVRYGHQIARKLFLVVIAFLVFGYWLSKQKKSFTLIKINFKYIIFIGLFLFLSRILTFDFWFYNDDIRFFQFHAFAPTQLNYNPQASWGPIGFHPIAIFLLVLRWFGTNYALYNTLGLFFYFLGGVAIFALLEKIQKNKFVSVTGALFFLTTPTYFQGRLLIGEIINSPFSLLLVILSILLLLYKFIPGALIFAAAALEYGVAKTYFIALPLTLFAIFFVNPGKNIFTSFFQNKKAIVFSGVLFFLSLIYKSAFLQAPSSSGKTFDLNELFVFGDVMLATTVPYGISYPLVHLLNLILNGWLYITSLLGFLVIIGFALAGVITYFKKQTLSAKLIVIGLSIIVPTVAIGSYMGVRVDHNILKLVQYHITNQIPSGATGYGFFPAFGLTLILVGLNIAINKKSFKVFVCLFILFNTIISISSDYKWRKSPYSLVQRKYDEQLEKILPRDGIDKYIYMPSAQRQFFEGVRTFGGVYQGDQGFFIFSGSKDFAQALKETKGKNVHIYFLSSEGEPNYTIHDYSDRISPVNTDSLEKKIESLHLEFGL